MPTPLHEYGAEPREPLRSPIFWIYAHGMGIRTVRLSLFRPRRSRFPDPGLALFAASKDNVKWLLARRPQQTIGPDKLNQLRGVRFLREPSGPIPQLMNQHKALVAPQI